MPCLDMHQLNLAEIFWLNRHNWRRWYETTF